MPACPRCGVEGQVGRFCAYCAAELPQEQSSPAVNMTVSLQTRGHERTAETEFLSDPVLAVHITSSRAMIAGSTYAVSNITSVSVRQLQPDRSRPILLVIVGLLFLVGSIVLGLMMIAGGIGWWVSQKTVFFVAIGTAGGEVRAIASTDRQQMTRIGAALNTAIVHRG